MPRYLPRYLPNEEQLLLLKAALLAREEAVVAWSSWLCRNDIDLTRSAALDLFPAVYRNIGGSLGDDGQRGRLHGAYRYAWARNQINFNRAAEIVCRLQEREIETLVLKGGALAGSVYEDIGMRSMTDVDLLVKPSRAEEAYEMLLAEGWRGERQHSGDMQRVVQVLRSVDLVGVDGARLDLHWHVLLECCDPGDDDGFWAAAVELEIAGAKSLRLCYEDMLLHVIVHGSYWMPLPGVVWAMDAYRIIETAGERLDWRRVVDQTRRRGRTLPMLTGLAYLRANLGVAIPNFVLDDLRAIRASLVERLDFRAQDVRPGPVGQVYRDFVGYLLRARRRPLGQKVAGWVWYLKAVLNLSSSWHVPLRMAFLAGRRQLRAVRTMGARGPVTEPRPGHAHDAEARAARSGPDS